MWCLEATNCVSILMRARLQQWASATPAALWTRSRRGAGSRVGVRVHAAAGGPTRTAEVGAIVSPAALDSQNDLRE